MNEEKVYATFYFGEPAAGADLENLFKAKNQYFYYMVEVTMYEFRITDTCGRMMPFDKESLKHFNLSMFGVTQTYAALDAADTLYAKKIDELEQVMDFYAGQL